MSRYFKYILIVTVGFSLFSNSSLNAQIVNIESKRMRTDSTRFVLNSDLLFNYLDNNGEYILQIKSNVSTQIKSKNLKSIYFLVGNFDLVRSANQDFQNSWFSHLRYNYKLLPYLSLETFVQSQNNTQQTINKRNLIGIGLRLKLLTRKFTNAYFGNSYLYEIEEINLGNERLYNHRNSSYLTLNQSFSKSNLRVIGSIYFQPLYSNVKNHRILSQLKVEIPLTKSISFSALYDYSILNFDSNLDDDYASQLSLGFSWSV